MQHEITLSKKEIGQVIEEYFKKNSYDVEGVNVECFMDYEGYGMGERVVPTVRATVICKDILLEEATQT